MNMKNETLKDQACANTLLSDCYLPIRWTDKPGNVYAVTTLRHGGVSTGDYSGYNLAMHVGDEPQAVVANREKLTADLKLPATPVWLDQVHSNKVIRIDESVASGFPAQADASASSVSGTVCAVLTADCLPVFFCDQSGTEVAVAHAGWRGLHAGIISHTIQAMRSPTSEILASLGPAIGPQSFEVGEEVFQAFIEKAEVNRKAFVATSKGHYLCDIYELARIELQAAGVDKIAGGGFCTYREKDRFYSYRRQQNTGRMASLIWFQ